MLLFAFISGLCCGSGPNAFLPTANNNRKKETITVYPNNQPLTATGSLPVPSATKREKKKKKHCQLSLLLLSLLFDSRQFLKWFFKALHRNCAVLRRETFSYIKVFRSLTYAYVILKDEENRAEWYISWVFQLHVFSQNIK